jgi:hypothetical protein
LPENDRRRLQESQSPLTKVDLQKYDEEEGEQKELHHLCIKKQLR